MDFGRASSAATFQSRAWSMPELGAGLAHLLNDMNAELPDDIASLQACSTW